MSGVRSEEFRGKTVDAAISAGLSAMRVAREAVDIEVIRPGSRGVLGIGAEDAIVRLTVRSAQRSEPQPATRGESSPVAPTPPPTPRARPERSPRPTPAPVASEPSDAPSADTVRPPRPAVASGTDKELTAAEQGSEILAGLLEHMNVRAQVEILQQSPVEAGDGEPVYVLNIVGDDLGAMIGRHNEVLTSLELVTRLMVNQKGHMHSSFVVDVNGYRAKRAESLRKLALRMAEQAIQTGRTMVLEPMPPSERRIIHITLRESPDVSTQSVGEGDHRKVTIIPKKA